MDYTVSQQAAIDAAVNNKKKLFKIGGAAGTGKSTILKAINKRIENLAVCCFCGKAASVLRAKGIHATTIHKRIYEWDEKDECFYPVPKVDYAAFAIDEASMVGGSIYKDLESYGIPIIAIGDPYQLEPVSDDDINLMKEPNILLTETGQRQPNHRSGHQNPNRRQVGFARPRPLPSNQPA